ncbi:MAG: collagenase [Bacteroidetes bacterium GWA2_31_9]|nr:MAG: collagenase [Bacteroidetes bacterium GWA2_31_9]
MSPAGSHEALMAAIQAGAGSVYFGIEQLNMRSKSTVNFTTADLKEIVKITNEHNVKSYLTVNTVLYDDDIPVMRKIIDSAKENKISAIIASDIAAINYAREIGVEVHISTQLNVSNYEAVKYFSKYADVIVLARELNLNQVKYITDCIEKDNLKGPSGNKVKIEMFVHGALCMAVSGKCYLSLHEQNYSANRGQCLQTCRKAYTVTEKESGYELEVDNEYIMSPKDLKSIHFLNKVLDSGVTVLKIEGRARAPEYVKTVTQCYHEAVDAYLNDSFTEEKIQNWDNRLNSVFNRGFWGGYFLGKKLGEWSHKYGSRATHKKVYVGKCTNYFSNLKVAEFLIETGDLSVNDDILIIGPTTGVIELKVPEIRVDLKAVPKTSKGQQFSMPVDDFIRRNDKLYKLVEAIDDSIE